MKIYGTRVYGISYSIVASGYPMKTNPDAYETPEKAWARARRLGAVEAGSGHDCYLKGIVVQANVEAPAYVWPQIQRYHWFEIVSSQSKMHRITKMDLDEQCLPNVDHRIIEIAKEYIVKFEAGQASFEDILANIPQGLELTAGISTNYLQLKTMYHQRKNHRLSFWNSIFVEWVKSLPHFMELIGEATL